ncbi:unnamed protein product [Lactuca virosa]|uniref:Asparagine synthetase domain-containing protein n=1 Tax=Lactuca virosa TaxID=75947 RepID=A0AAU9NZL2_9ASTR|nr:unnamed protein product [Lactuca virosa]
MYQLKQLGLIHMKDYHRAGNPFVLPSQEGIDALEEVIYHLETYDVTTIRASTPMFLMSRKIKSLGVKMVLSGEGSDEIFSGYLYFHKAPNKEEFHEETCRKIQRDIGRIEKWVLRNAFDDAENPYLPKHILYRQKEQFSDGVGYSWIDGLKDHANQQVTDSVLTNATFVYPENTRTTKEVYYYRTIFEKFFPKLKLQFSPTDCFSKWLHLSFKVWDSTKNIPTLGQTNTVYAIDLLGFGASDKTTGFEYTMEAWAELILDFLDEIVQRPRVLIGNSVGSLACVIAAAGYNRLCELGAEINELEKQRDKLETELKKVKNLLAFANGRFQNATEEREQFDDMLITSFLYTSSQRVEADTCNAFVEFLEAAWDLQYSFMEEKEKKVNDELETHEEYFINVARSLLRMHRTRYCHFEQRKSLENAYVAVETKVLTIFGATDSVKEQFYQANDNVFSQDELI